MNAMQSASLFATFVLCAVPQSSSAASPNLVANPGFEQIKVVDTIKPKDGLAFDCEIVKRDGPTLQVRTRAATVPWKMEHIEKIGKRDTAQGWVFYEIKLPVADVIDKSTGHGGGKGLKLAADKGKGFMHSTPFAVAAGKSYEVSAWVKGKGKATLHVLWWAKYTDEEIEMCKHHLDATAAVQASGEWRQVGKTFAAPEGATKAYVRLVGEGADVWFDDVSVSSK